MASLKKQLEIESKSGQDLGAGHSVGFGQSNIFEEKSVFVLCVCCEPFNIIEEKCSVLIIGFMFNTFVHFVSSSLIYWTQYNTIILWIVNTIQYNSSLNSEQNIQGIPHVLLVRGKPQGPGVRIGLGQKWPMTKAWLESDNCKAKAIQIFFQHTFFLVFLHLFVFSLRLEQVANILSQSKNF